MEAHVTLNKDEIEFQKIARDELITLLQNEEVVIEEARVIRKGKTTRVEIKAYYTSSK